MTRESRAEYRRKDAANEASILAEIVRQRDEQYAAWDAQKAARAVEKQAERDRVKHTAADLAGVTHIRDQFGWHRVIRVNAVTVTVATPYSWKDHIKFADILDVRTVTK